ncbi:hypothetical protein CPB83DRAFT_858013 [Crepidotus variabilis]|uniref:Uncharacterized protein n=1 Tax=Crepidotus variabilis TaxID=179855 RepID=A0A9P6JN73_9AGAR|nr:hypothetical protein CPB83DRAFT_858013 [Crepidotus variabilis]
MSPVSPRTPLRSPTTGAFSAQQQRRHVTDPVDRRRSVFKAFKRSTTRDTSSERENEEPPTSPTQKSRGMFSSVRKSVIGSISGGRMKRSATTPPVTAAASGTKAFNTAGLPASPTLPSRFAISPATAAARERSTSRDRVSQTSRDTAGAPRQAVAPPMYNRGSILIEASAIEDEESRRMTELAFLG